MAYEIGVHPALFSLAWFTIGVLISWVIVRVADDLERDRWARWADTGQRPPTEKPQ